MKYYFKGEGFFNGIEFCGKCRMDRLIIKIDNFDLVYEINEFLEVYVSDYLLRIGVF